MLYSEKKLEKINTCCSQLNRLLTTLETQGTLEIQAEHRRLQGYWDYSLKRLKKAAEGSRSEMASVFARVHLESLEKLMFSVKDHLPTACFSEANAESRLLLAEYAMDHAAQALCYAAMAVLEAAEASQAEGEEGNHE